MKKHLIQTAALACLLAACSPQKPVSTDGLTVIDVESALGNVEDELKLSDVYDSVRYVPLETSDSCLIGERPYSVLTDKYILVCSQQEEVVYTFDRHTGRFLAKIAHKGRGPEDYSYSNLRYNSHDGLLYFFREPDQLQKYDPLDGYHGRVVLQNAKMPSSLLFTDSLIIGMHMRFDASKEYMADMYDRDGLLVDSLVDPAVRCPFEGSAQMLSIKTAASATLIIADYDGGNIWADLIPGMYVYDNAFKYQRPFSDTVYTVEGGKMRPSIAFHTGKFRFPQEGRTREVGNSDKLVITRVKETAQRVTFSCVRDIYGDNPEGLYGIYDRNTGNVRMARDPGSEEANLDGFFISQIRLVEAYRVVEWLEEHPEANNDPAFASLKNIDMEDNPVAILAFSNSQ